MCTVINQTASYHLFGRTLDLSYTYGEEVVITPHAYPFSFRHQQPNRPTSPMMGIAHVSNGYPLYYDAMNTHGLCMAALRFPTYTMYHPYQKGKQNLASFEVIPYVLGQCHTMQEALKLLQDTNITPDAYSPQLPPTPLHWMLSDGECSVVLESTQSGVEIYSNPAHVMTNAPTFDIQQIRLDVMTKEQQLPGDMSSTSRLVRGVYANTHTCHEDNLKDEICRFFHVMGMVSVPKGCWMDDDQRPVYTVYTSCGHPPSMTYHVSTYDDPHVRSVSAKTQHLWGNTLVKFPIHTEKI